MARLIQHVCLTAPDAQRVRRGALLLEDALRTAALPGAGPGRLLLVRYLHVGAIDTTRSPTALSVAIEERLRLLRATAVYAGSSGAPHAGAVYFHDQAEAYGLLALRLARGQPADAWFWRLAVPGLGRRAPLRALALSLARASAAPTALLYVVETLLEQEALDPLLASLAPPDGLALLAALSRPAPHLQAGSPAAPPLEAQADLLRQPWRAALRVWAGRWGRSDARSLWLAAVALAAERPTRLLDPALPRRAAALVMQELEPAARSLASPPTDSASAADAPAAEAESAAPAPLLSDGMLALTAPMQAARPPQRDAPRLAAEADASAPAPTPLGRAAPRAAAVTARGAQAARPASAAAVAGPPLALPRPTALGGLFFLIPVLERLGLAGFLEQSPAWIEADLGWALLRRAAAALALPEADPLRLVLGEGAALAPQLLFVCPPQWRAGVAALQRVSLHRVACLQGRRVLLDGTGRLPLACWTGRRPPGVRGLVEGAALTVGPPLAAPPSPARAWLAAARRWLRRSAAHTGLRSLIVRPGLVSATRTHVDVYFDHDQTDVRLRRLGLDLDPGWVPWLGRVVCFHYIYGAYGR